MNSQFIRALEMQIGWRHWAKTTERFREYPKDGDIEIIQSVNDSLDYGEFLREMCIHCLNTPNTYFMNRTSAISLTMHVYQYLTT